tara:strand:- start:1216 stop:3228 length:2013 start_codon:yes stop_codon:yes gene_type:complete
LLFSTKIHIFLLLPFFLFSQQTEKRLALVIGNSNYDKGELKNPVNDARLIAATLDSLNFDVILNENLATKRDMIAAIREFGSKRSEYDVAFVYYAGHGIQVDDENFLLPTREIFDEEFDVLDYGVSVQNIMRYLRAQTSEVNILILDACRDNPFESKWNTTRSLKSKGLAKIPPPTGSLIAFSTDSGQTAPDGDGDNSVYTISLAKNMLLEDTSIDQVFRNVRAEVLTETDGIQRPVEATQLTGQSFYLKKPTSTHYLKKIDELILSEKFKEALEVVNNALYKYPEDSGLYSRRGHVNILLNNNSAAFQDYKKSIEINPKESSSYFIQVNFENKLQSLGIMELKDYMSEDEIINKYNTWVYNDIDNAIALQERARFYNWYLDNQENAMSDLYSALEILQAPKNHNNSRGNYLFFNDMENISNYLFSTIYINISYVLTELERYDEALIYADRAILNDPNFKNVDGWAYYAKGTNFENKNLIEQAIKSYQMSFDLMPEEPMPLVRTAIMYNSQGDFKNANSFFDKAAFVVKAVKSERIDYAILLRSIFRYQQGHLVEALQDLYYIEYVLNYENNLISNNLNVPLIKGLILKDLDALDLARVEIKKYFSFIYDDTERFWFENVIALNPEDILIPHNEFYKMVYSNPSLMDSNISKPWGGDENLAKEIKELFNY